MIVYRKTSGSAHDVRLVDEDYQLQDGELSLPGWEIPALDTLHDPVDPKVAHNAAIDAQIDALEASVTERRKREALLTDAGRAWLADVDARITALRKGRG